MKRLLTLAAVASAAIATSACVTVIGGDGDDYAWNGEGAQPFDSARSSCTAQAGSNEGTTAFIECMAGKGWTRVKN